VFHNRAAPSEALFASCRRLVCGLVAFHGPCDVAVDRAVLVVCLAVSLIREDGAVVVFDGPNGYRVDRSVAIFVVRSRGRDWQ